MRWQRWKAVLVSLGVSACVASAAVEEDPLSFFESRIRPLLAESCFECHGSEKQKGGLRLDARESILRGGESGAAIVPGKPEESLLIEAVAYRSADLEMPPKRKLGKRALADLERWVAMGAPWPEGDAPRLADQASAGERFAVTEADRAYWAFQPLRERREAHFDDLIEGALAEKGLVPNPPASRETLIRRAYIDLIGLPPTYEEVQAFVRDPDPEAFPKLVDRLLAMPEYGERWGRHWLDVVRFAQSNGYERDDEKPQAWRYRDYVIAAFNNDKPYDRFVLEQIAGDELPAAGDEGWIATGMHRLGVWDDEPDDKRAAEFDELDDILQTTTETFLGLTVGCARCHDHMFDPISQREYYGLLAFFRNARPYAKPGEDTIRKLGSGEALVLTERGPQPLDTHFLVRGNAGRPADKVEPGFPEVLGGGRPEVTATAHSTGRRLAFARWVARPDHPLTARVMVNRLWHYHTGRGIVASPNDFGKAGHPPTNEALLDWLAAEFLASGWSIKHMHRVIMNSRAWQRSSTPNPANEALDPGNLLSWRSNLRRMESEVIRDAILKASGNLNPERGGRGFFPAVAGEVVAGASRPGRNWQWSPVDQQRRRSVYAFVKRTMLYPFFEIFDYANTEGSLGARPSTTVAPQALLLLNSEFVSENAAELARVCRSAEDPVGEAFRRVLGRDAAEEERELADSFLRQQEDRFVPLAGQIVFRPDYPGALYTGYQENLPPERFLRGPEAGWTYFKGRWEGAYEGIVGVDREHAPCALLDVPRGVSRLEGRIRLGETSERASLFLGARVGEDRVHGDEFLIDPARGRLAIRSRSGDTIETLAEARFGWRPGGWWDVAAGWDGERLFLEVGDTRLEADATGPAPGEQFGVSTFAGEFTLDALKLWTAEGRVDVSLRKESEDFAARRAFEEFCGMLFNLNEFVYVD